MAQIVEFMAYTTRNVLRNSNVLHSIWMAIIHARLAEWHFVSQQIEMGIDESAHIDVNFDYVACRIMIHFVCALCTHAHVNVCLVIGFLCSCFDLLLHYAAMGQMIKLGFDRLVYNLLDANTLAAHFFESLWAAYMFAQLSELLAASFEYSIRCAEYVATSTPSTQFYYCLVTVGWCPTECLVWIISKAQPQRVPYVDMSGVFLLRCHSSNVFVNSSNFSKNYFGNQKGPLSHGVPSVQRTTNVYIPTQPHTHTEMKDSVDFCLLSCPCRPRTFESMCHVWSIKWIHIHLRQSSANLTEK